MHEYGIVRELVARLARDVAGLGSGQKVMEVRLRCGCTYCKDSLRRAFAMVAPGTPLAEATLVIEEFSEVRACDGCGSRQRIAVEDIREHEYVCPECGTRRHVDEAYGLEVLAVTVEESPEG